MAAVDAAVMRTGNATSALVASSFARLIFVNSVVGVPDILRLREGIECSRSDEDFFRFFLDSRCGFDGNSKTDTTGSLAGAAVAF